MPVGTWVRARVPAIEWITTYRRADLRGDLIAGATGAAILVPQSMAYATIGGLPPVVGLYASVVPVLVYAVFGRARQLSVGPLATISIIGAASVARLSPQGSAQFIGYSATLALLVGGVHLALGIGRLGWLLRFLSEPVMRGFIAAVGVTIITTQLGPLCGVTVETTALPWETVGNWLRVVDETSVATLAVGLTTLAFLFLLRSRPRVPSALVAVVVATLVTSVFDLHAHGVAVVGAVPSGLAGFEVPPTTWHAVRILIPAAIAITFVGFVESMALAREQAERHGYRIHTDDELVALGLTNVSAGLFQGMVVTGAVTRSTIVDAAGARTQFSGVVTAAIVAPLLAWWSGAFEDIPLAALAAIVIVAVLGFVNLSVPKRLWVVSRSDFWMWTVALFATLVLGIEIGILVAVGTSIALLVLEATRPRLAALGVVDGSGVLVERARHPDASTIPGCVLVRIGTAVTFTNAEPLEAQLRAAIEPADAAAVTTLVVEMSAVNRIDATGEHALRTVLTAAVQRGITVLLVAIADEVRPVLDRGGVTALVGPDAFFADDQAALRRVGRDEPPPTLA